MSPGLIEMLRIMGMPRCVEAADVIESQAAELAHHKAWVAHQTKRIAELEAALAQPAAPVHDELGDRFMEILRAIHGDMPDAFADSARLAFVHAMKEAQPAVPATDRYSELADALGCDSMDSHAARIERARRLAAHPPSQSPREPLSERVAELEAAMLYVKNNAGRGDLVWEKARAVLATQEKLNEQT